MQLSIEDVKKRHTEALMALPGVVSVGIGRNTEGNPAIIIGYDGAHPATLERVPQSLDNYPVIVKEIGPVKSQRRPGSETK